MAVTDPKPEHTARARRAIAFAVAVAGGQAQLARGVSEWFTRRGIARAIGKTAVSQWLTHGRLLDPEYWPAVEEITDCRVTRRQLRPDLFDLLPHDTGEAQEIARELVERVEARL